MSSAQETENKEALTSKQDDAQESQDSDVVPKRAYAEVKSDLFRFKTEAKELKAKLAQIQADEEARKTEAMKEQQKWRELYASAETKLKAIEQERAKEQKQFIDAHKINSVVQTLGGFKKNEYTRFVNVDAVEVLEDGTVSLESVEKEVARIKQEFPELLKVSAAQPIPSKAPKTPEPKQIKDMSPEELNEYRRKIISGEI